VKVAGRNLQAAFQQIDAAPTDEGARARTAENKKAARSIERRRISPGNESPARTMSARIVRNVPKLAIPVKPIWWLALFADVGVGKTPHLGAMPS
jgi:hypothetical protein